GLSVSMFSFETMSYVTGLQFVLETGQSVKLGYIIPSKETYISLSGLEKDKSCELLGFKLAVTSRGISAIACITSSERVTQWAGSPNNLPQMLLIGKETLSCLRGTFDVSYQPILL